jgi:hypothetical protein
MPAIFARVSNEDARAGFGFELEIAVPAAADAQVSKAVDVKDAVTGEVVAEHPIDGIIWVRFGNPHWVLEELFAGRLLDSASGGVWPSGQSGGLAEMAFNCSISPWRKESSQSAAVCNGTARCSAIRAASCFRFIAPDQYHPGHAGTVDFTEF